MPVTLTPTIWFNNLWSIQGRQYFAISWSGLPDAVFVRCTFPAALQEQARGRSIFLTDLDISYWDADSTGGIYSALDYIFLTSGTIGYTVYLASFTTGPGRYFGHQWHDINASFEGMILNTGVSSIYLNAMTGIDAVNDSITLVLRGYIEKSALIEPPMGLQPVSVEGYKWPLTRR